MPPIGLDELLLLAAFSIALFWLARGARRP